MAKRKAAELPGYDPGMFRGVNTINDFAAAIGVVPDAIKFVRPNTSSRCSVRDCPFFSVEGNYGHCVVHSQQWFPKDGQQRGHLLKSSDFMRPRHGSKITCDCDMPSCFGLGYCPMGYVPIPSEPKARDEVLSVPNLFNQEKKSAILQKRRIYHLALWHYFAEHREKKSNGTWALQDKHPPYYDLERQTAYTYPPPRLAPSKWYDLEFNRENHIEPKERWAAKSERKPEALPSWMMDMLRADTDKAVSAWLPSDDDDDDGNGSDRGKKITLAEARKEMQLYRN